MRCSVGLSKHHFINIKNNPKWRGIKPYGGATFFKHVLP